MMKSFLLSFCSVFLLSGLLVDAQAADHPMLDIASDYFSPGRLPEAYEAKELHRRLRMSRSLVRFLEKKTQERKRKFLRYVKESGEYDHLSVKEYKELLRDPAEGLGVQYLIQIERVFLILKDGKPIGYVYDCADHAEAAIIQDGAGITIYLDEDLNVLVDTEWTA